MSRLPIPIVLLLAATAACSSSSASSSGDGGATGTALTEVRGQRYCEILLGTLQGQDLHVEVYNTEGLNDCPDAAWSQIDAAAVKADTMSDVVLLNGPRYWTLDSQEGSSLKSTDVRTIGGIDMRQAGAIDLPTADLAMLQAPYTQHTIQRNSSFHWYAGKKVYEIVDDAGHVYDMQSYSVQKTAQTEASLDDLASKLTLPQGWSYRARVLDQQLDLTATSGTWTVIQDDFLNTYSLSQ
jgi:hypothetical protein